MMKLDGDWYRTQYARCKKLMEDKKVNRKSLPSKVH